VTKTIPADLEPAWQKLIDDVSDRGDEVLFTREGKPVAKLIPMQDHAPRKITPEEAEERERALARLRGRMTIVGDIVAPLDEEWDANQ
jgi:antitoxin (DNA-binding transcriptional repressor) of toxin-antitoxin stability system